MWSMVIQARWICGKSPMNMWYSSCSLAAWVGLGLGPGLGLGLTLTRQNPNQAEPHAHEHMVL